MSICSFPLLVSIQQSTISLPGVEYNTDLGNTDSTEYMELAEQIQQALENIFTDIMGEQYVTVLQFM